MSFILFYYLFLERLVYYFKKYYSVLITEVLQRVL